MRFKISKAILPLAQCLLLVLVLCAAGCTPGVTAAPTAYTATPTVTPLPTPTVSPAPTPTPTPTAVASFQGIDVSDFQGDINFVQVKNSGIVAVYIRAGEGDSFTDSRFIQNYQKAQAAGLDFGFYFVMNAQNEAGARSQAARFASMISAIDYTMRPAMDFGSDGLSDSEKNTLASAFLSELEDLTGQLPALYSDANAVNNLWEDNLAAYGLWIADYGRGADNPPPTGPWAAWAGYQYSNTGRVNGINGNVDLDLYTQDILVSGK